MALLPWDVTSTVVIVLGLTVVYLVGTAIYETKIHPLSSFPGPTICALTRIPFWWTYVRGNQATWIRRLHAIYGPVVRYGPTELSYIDKAAWKDIYGYKKGGNEALKDLAFQAESPNGAVTIIAADHEPHARLRRAFSSAFTEKALRQQEPLFQSYASLMVAKLNAAQGRPLDLAKMFNFVTFDSMADLTFGEPLGLLETGAYTDWVASLFDSVSVMPFFFLLRFYPLLRTLQRWFEPRALTARRLANFRYSTVRVDGRLARGAAKPDIWSLALGRDADRPALSLAEMHCNAELLMLAGTETTSTWLSGLVYLLLRNPDRLARLRAEIDAAADAAAADGAPAFSFGRLTPLPYLNACLDEALRIYPPAPLAQPRIVSRREGREVAGRWVPPGTTVSVPHLAAYRSAANFKNPERFVPERWLGDPEYADDQRDVFKPFSYGPRGCLGQRMAYHQGRLLAAQVLYNFDIELCDPARNWMDQKIFILWDKTPLMCSVRRRGSSAPAAPAWRGGVETV